MLILNTGLSNAVIINSVFFLVASTRACSPTHEAPSPRSQHHSGCREGVYYILSEVVRPGTKCKSEALV